MPLKSNKKKLLIITQSFIKYQGDILSKHIFVAAKLLTRAGWEVSVLAPHESKLAFYEEIEGVKVFRFKYFFERYERLAYSGRMQQLVLKNPINFIIFLFFMFVFLLRALQLVKRTRPSFLHAHWWIPTGVLGCLVSRLRNVPLLVTLHGTDVRLIRKNLAFTCLAKWVFKHATGITVVSNFIKSQLVGTLGVPPEKIFVLPMPIDPEKIYKKQMPPRERKMILCVARYTRQKNLDTLIRAFHRVYQERRDLDLIIIGEGPQRQNLLGLTRELGLETKVFLYDLMRQEELNDYYNASEMVVLPSIDEGFGLVLVEEQWLRKPVIGARSGGIPDIIEDGKTGLLFPPKDHQSLASAIERVLSDESLASRLAEAGYRSAVSNFSQEAFLRRYLEVLKWTQRRF
ncbi:MAG: glycosyltransferase family 4 protein [Candidatus Zixiibacteriota bacterium]